MADERTRKFFSGRSVEQAVVAAASYYGIDPSEVDYREIEKRHGFVRTRRKAVIAVDPDHPRKAPAAPAEERRVEAPRERRPAGAERRPSRERHEAEGAAEPPAGAASERGGGRAAGSREEREAPDERPRRERRGRGRGRDSGEERPRRERPAGSARKPSEATAPTPPWWLAEPVEEEETEEPEAFDEEFDEEAEELEAEDLAEDAEEDAERGDGGEEEPGGRRREGERFRHVRPSEGLRRRTPPARATEGRGEAAGRDAGRGGERGRGRRRRGRGPESAGETRARKDVEREPAAAPPPPAPPEPRIPRSERLPREEGELADAAREALERLLDFVGVEAEADLYRDGERLEIELWGPDDHILLEEEGQLLLAFEHLLPRMIRGIYGDALPVRVDCNDFHAEREDRLRDLARRTADEVRRRGRPRTLEEMDPAERRIVHITLEEDPTVTTESIGDGYFKKLKVLPA